MRTTLAMNEWLYEQVRTWATRDGVSINEWMVKAIDREDTRRRCIAHDAWLAENPEIAQALTRQAELARQQVAEDIQTRRGVA